MNPTMWLYFSFRATNRWIGQIAMKLSPSGWRPIIVLTPLTFHLEPSSGPNLINQSILINQLIVKSFMKTNFAIPVTFLISLACYSTKIVRTLSCYHYHWGHVTALMLHHNQCITVRRYSLRAASIGADFYSSLPKKIQSSHKQMTDTHLHS